MTVPAVGNDLIVVDDRMATLSIATYKLVHPSKADVVQQAPSVGLQRRDGSQAACQNIGFL